MMLVLNIEFFKIRPCGVCSSKENGACSTVEINPTNYLVHPTLFRQTPSHVRTNPKCGVCSNSEKSNFNMFSDCTLFVI